MNVNDVLSTSSINSLVDSYKFSETSKSVDPLTSKKSKYQNLVSQYGIFSSKISALKTLTDMLKNNGTDSVFKSKVAVVPDNNYFSATASSTLQKNSFSLKVLQLAKSDLVFSSSLPSSDTIPISGNQGILVKTADGKGGEFFSHISVSLSNTETYQTTIDKVKDSILNDQAEINSLSKSESDLYSGGDTSFKVNISGEEHIVNITAATTYNDVMDQVKSQLSGITGFTVTKLTNNGNISLNFALTDKNKDLTISNNSSFDIVSDLSIAAQKEKSASSVLSVSSFKPEDLKTRLSISSINTGLDYRIKEISDINGGTLLTQLGMNFGNSRTQFDQTSSPDGSGFLYSDISSTSLLNSKFELNGITLQRNSNQVNNVIDGLTLNLKGVMKSDDQPISFTTGTDTNAIKDKINSFISKFNDLFSFTAKAGADIKNDANVRTINQTLSSAAFSLYKIGVSFSPGVGLSVSSSDLLTKAINETPEMVEDLFTSDSGIAKSLSGKFEPYLGSGGILNRGVNSYNNNISWLTEKINNNQSRIDKSAESLRRRYQDLQVQVSSLLSAQGYF